MGDIGTLELEQQLSLLLASDVSGRYGAFEAQVLAQVLDRHQEMTSLAYMQMANYLRQKGLHIPGYEARVAGLL